MNVWFAVSALLLALLSGIHVYWAFGGKWGSDVAVPVTLSRQPAFVPGKIGTLIVALLLLASSALLVIETGLVTGISEYSPATWGCLVCAVVFGLRAVGDFRYVGIAKKIRGTRFAVYDSFLFTPLCALLSLMFFMAIGTGG
ncbi:DUF3995 domain-containing protein [Paenibacillus sp. MBLB4367]|uniref:DUF3995 domain-containing protein n=1 Tax=Paenibacillus sp. MBLB4367 TaxID=3384767 RepID=UPI0039080622